MNCNVESESDDEVFVGPVTIKEIKKALTLRRKTIVLDKCEEGKTVEEKDQNLEELKNLTFTPQPRKLPREIDDPHMRRSMSLAIHPTTFEYAVNGDTVEMDASEMTSNSETDSFEIDEDITEDSLEIETPAPPPSPENRYNGSPYPTPCRTRRRHFSSLKEIAEEEGSTPKHYEKNTPKHYEGNTPKSYEGNTPKRSAFFPEIPNVVHLGEWRDTHESFNVSEESSHLLSYDSISILSKMDDNLIAETSKLSLEPSVSCESNKMNLSDMCENKGEPEEKLKNRELLIEKMKQYEAVSQQLKNSKKYPAMSESSTDDVIILNSEENEFSLDEDNPVVLDSSQSKKLEMFIEETDGTLNSESPMKVVTVDIGDEDRRFSRLISEREVVANTDLNNSAQGIFLCDLERRYGKERFDQALANLSPQIRLEMSSEIENDTHESLPDVDENRYSLTNGELSPVRSSSPEFEIDLPCEKSTTAEPVSGTPYVFVTADYSMISEAEVPGDENANSGNVRTADVFTADKDGGFLSVLSEAALYHASLKHSGNCVTAPSSNMIVESTEEFVENIDDFVPQDDKTHNENLDKSDSVLYLSNLSTKVSCVINEDHSKREDERLQQSYDVKIEQSMTRCSVDSDDRMNLGHSLHDVDVSLHTCSREMDATTDLNESDKRNLERTTSEFSSDDEKNNFHDTIEEMEMLMKYGINKDHIKREDERLQQSYDVKIEQSMTNDSDNVRMNLGRSLHDVDVSLHTTCSREMNATADLNESDKRNMERTTSEFSSDDNEKDSFHDTIEEMEMLMKYGMDYVLSSNDVDFKNSPNREDKNSVFNNVSTPKNTDLKKFEDFEDEIRDLEHNGPEDCDSFTEQTADKCGPSTSQIAGNIVDRTSELGSPLTDVYTSEKNLRDVSFPKQQFTPSREATPSREVTSNIQSANKRQDVNQHFKKPSPFKLPIRPISSIHTQKPVLHTAKKSPLKSTLVSPCKKTANYNQIVSPVGAYIHNTPSPSLVTNVKPKLHRTTPRKLPIGRSPATPANTSFKAVSEPKTPCGTPVMIEKGLENVDINNVCPVLPVVDYSSVPLIKLEKSQTEKMPRVNERMKKLVDTPRPRVIRHEGRVKVVPMKSSPLKKYASDSNDSYVADSDADGEISVVVGKRASRTNTLGF